MTPHDGILSYKTPYTGPNQVCVANGTKLPISNIGHLKLVTRGRPLNLNSVYHVPHIKYNLLSIQKLCAD
ncbi:unnamed protein product, partial [Cuscuta epithymum]